MTTRGRAAAFQEQEQDDDDDYDEDAGGRSDDSRTFGPASKKSGKGKVVKGKAANLMPEKSRLQVDVREASWAGAGAAAHVSLSRTAQCTFRIEMSNSDFYVNLDATPHALILHLDALLPTLFKEMADWTDKAMLEDMKPANPHGFSEEEMNQRQGAWNYDLATPVIIKLNDVPMIPRGDEDITLKNPTKYDQDNDGKLKTVGLPAILTVGLKKYPPQVNFDLRSSAQRYVADCLEDKSLLVSDCQNLFGTQPLQEKLKIAYSDDRPPGMYVTPAGQQAQSSGPWLDVVGVSGFAHVSIAAYPPGGLGPTALAQSGTASKAKGSGSAKSAASAAAATSAMNHQAGAARDMIADAVGLAAAVSAQIIDEVKKHSNGEMLLVNGLKALECTTSHNLGGIKNVFVLATFLGDSAAGINGLAGSNSEAFTQFYALVDKNVVLVVDWLLELPSLNTIIKLSSGNAKFANSVKATFYEVRAPMKVGMISFAVAANSHAAVPVSTVKPSLGAAAATGAAASAFGSGDGFQQYDPTAYGDSEAVQTITESGALSSIFSKYAFVTAGADESTADAFGLGKVVSLDAHKKSIETEFRP